MEAPGVRSCEVRDEVAAGNGWEGECNGGCAVGEPEVEPLKSAVVVRKILTYDVDIEYLQ
jgi:hypothetical protein